jgi:AraC family transcriptional activator of pobA
MDATAAGWYFSPMPQPPSRAPDAVEFHRTKYGRELLIDAAWVRSMPTFLRGSRPHRLAFHDILLVTRGRGRFLLDGERHPVAPGTAFFTRPGELREWQVAGLDGACLFFTEEFVAETFADPRFLEQFAYFAPERPSGVLRLEPATQRAVLARFRAMQREIRASRDDAPEALRAALYETLVLLNRAYAARFGGRRPAPAADVVRRFQALVDRDFATRHRVADYARALGVSPGHLNALCRGRLRRSAGGLIRARRTLEARRLLRQQLGAAQVADRLGFDDPAYFSRFFRREVGVPPSRYRLR